MSLRSSFGKLDASNLLSMIIITWGNQYENSSRGPDPAALIRFWCVTENVDKIVGNYIIYRVIRVQPQNEDKKIVLNLNSTVGRWHSIKMGAVEF